MHESLGGNTVSFPVYQIVVLIIAIIWAYRFLGDDDDDTPCH